MTLEFPSLDKFLLLVVLRVLTGTQWDPETWSQIIWLDPEETDDLEPRSSWKPSLTMWGDHL